MMIKIGKLCFWLSVGIGITGQIITFYPGSEFGWFVFAALLAIPGFFIPKGYFKAGSLVMLVLWSFMAFNGHARGKEYQQWLKHQQHIENPEESINSTKSNG